MTRRCVFSSTPGRDARRGRTGEREIAPSRPVLRSRAFYSSMIQYSFYLSIDRSRHD
jgi:hypothetical protein